MGVGVCPVNHAHDCRYMEGVDGNYRLQVERYESLELNNANIGVAAVVDPKINFVLKRETKNVRTSAIHAARCHLFLTRFFDF